MDYVDLEEILIEVLASFYKDFKDKGIEPIINIGEEDFIVIGDKRAVERIFTNLISNSLKYGKDCLEIKLEMEEDKIVSEFINDTVGLEYEDIKRYLIDFLLWIHLDRGNRLD